MEGTGVVWEEEAQSLWEAVRAKKPKKKSLVDKEIIAIMSVDTRVEETSQLLC